MVNTANRVLEPCKSGVNRRSSDDFVGVLPLCCQEGTAAAAGFICYMMIVKWLHNVHCVDIFSKLQIHSTKRFQAM